MNLRITKAIKIMKLLSTLTLILVIITTVSMMVMANVDPKVSMMFLALSGFNMLNYLFIEARREQLIEISKDVETLIAGGMNEEKAIETAIRRKITTRDS